MNLKPTHERKIVGYKEYVDKKGKTRKRPIVEYQRTRETQIEMEKLRLGRFVKYGETNDERVIQHLDTKLLIVSCPHNTANVITTTCLLRNRSPHKILTGTDILHEFLRRDTEDKPLMAGYPLFSQLFVFFGYLEATNKYLPQLLNQLVGLRFHRDEHIWVFIPDPPSPMAFAAAAGISYIPTVHVPSLTDVENRSGPQGQEALPPSPSEEINSRDDPKLIRKQRRSRR